MRRTNFTAEIRVLLCEHCGAPLEAPVGGGTLACTYCRAQNVVANRDERPTLGMPAVPMPIDEAERLRRLRAQDGQPLLPPPSLMPLLEGSSFAAAKVQEAFLIYQATRKEVRATHSPDAAERLFFLTLVASNYLAEQNDEPRRRALLETSLDALFLPRHKQIVRAQLTVAAAAEGDVHAAERWLAPCDARSDDLDSDSAYRVARAFVDTVQHRWQAVLAVLGSADGEVPIADMRDPQAAVLRANALERLGNVPAAVEALRSRMKRENAQGRHAIERFVALNRSLSLCPQSLPLATEAHTTDAAKVAASGAGGGTGLVLAVVGAGMILLGLGIAAAAMIPGLMLAFTTRSPAALLAIAGGAFAGAIGPGLGGVIMLGIGLALRRNAKEASHLRVHGLRARGTIRNVERTGTKINGVPMVRVHVSVSRDGAAPYDASFTQLAHVGLIAQLAPGAQVPLRVHPQRPEKILLELQ